MRSTMTMMKYLARTSSDGELNKVITQSAQQYARCEGSLAERRRREGKLRNEQEEAEVKMTEGMQTLAMSLQAQAQNKALAKARQAQQLRAKNLAAEEAARVMGAIAPHRAAARDAALSVVAPKESWASGISGMGSSQDALHGFGSGTSDAQYSVLLAENAACLAVRPGKYCLRCHAAQPAGIGVAAAAAAAPGGGAEGGEAEPTFFGYALSGVNSATLALGTAHMAAAAPWTVRQPSGHRACTFATSAGAKLYATPAGVLSIGDPPRTELAQFVVLPQHDVHAAAAAAAAPPDARGGRSGRGGAGGGGGEQPSPRPFSSPRMGGGAKRVAQAAALAGASPRPQTADGPYGSTIYGSPPPTGDPSAPLLVRLYHPPSRKFLHVSAETGSVSLLHAPDPNPPMPGTRAPPPPPPPPAPGLVFELLQQHGPPPRFCKGASACASAGSRPGTRGSDTGGGRQGGMPGQPYSQSRLASAQRPRPVVPVRGFDMATGDLQGRRRHEHEDEHSIPSWALSVPGAEPLGPYSAGLLRGGGGSTQPAAAATGAAATGGRVRGVGSMQTGAPLHPTGGGPRLAHGRQAQPAGSPAAEQDKDETRRTAWEASQLDLSDVIRPGLNLGSLFGGMPSAPVSTSARAPPSRPVMGRQADLRGYPGGYRPVVVTSPPTNLSARSRAAAGSGGAVRSAGGPPAGPTASTLPSEPRLQGGQRISAEPAHALAPQLYVGSQLSPSRLGVTSSQRAQRFQAR